MSTALDTHSALKRIALLQQELGNIVKDLDELRDFREDDDILQSRLEGAADYVRYALGELARAEEQIESEAAR